MNKLLQSILLFVFLVSTAMQCDNRTLKIAQEMDLQVNPNPIPIEDGKTIFELITTLPAIKTLKKMDSLVFELSYQVNDELVPIGTNKMSIPGSWNGTTNLYDTTTFELTDFSVPDYTTLYFQMDMFKDGSKKTTELLAISRFKNKKDEK